jgi:hypothetical protein
VGPTNGLDNVDCAVLLIPLQTSKRTELSTDETRGSLEGRMMYSAQLVSLDAQTAQFGHNPRTNVLYLTLLIISNRGKVFAGQQRH